LAVCLHNNPGGVTSTITPGSATITVGSTRKLKQSIRIKDYKN
jgi:hypothetical protein